MKAKKNLVLIHSVLLILVSILAFTTCKAGLGESVDTNPPKMNIAYPPANSIVRDWFMMSGLAEDETYVKDVVVAFKGKETHTFKADVDKEKKQWTLKVNTKSGGRYPIADGQYEVTVTATDSAGRKTSAKITYYIDNTPPVLVLQRPSTKSESDVSLLDPFGQEIKFSGNWWDSNGNDGCTLVINFFDKTGTEFLKSHTQNLPTQNWEIALGSGNPAWDALNSKIVDQAATPFAYTLSLSDDASEWKDPSKPNEPSNATGNVINHYYLYSDLTAKLTVGDKYPKLSDLSAVEQGRAISEVPSSISSALTSLQIPASPHVWDNTMGMFSFDPNDKNPSFEIDNLKIRANGGTVNPNDNSVSKYPVFNIKIKPNKDGDAIQQDSIKITYIPIKTDKTLDETNSVLTEGASLKKSTIGSIVNVNYSKNLEQGAFRLIIYAMDFANHEKTETYDVYINTGAPVLRSVSPDKSPQNTKVNSSGGKFTVVVKGTDGDDGVILIVTDDATNQVLNGGTDYTVTLGKKEIGYDYEYTWTLGFASGGDGTSKKLRFQLNDGQFVSSVETINFVVDDTLPQLKRLTKPAIGNSFPFTDPVLLSDQSVTIQGYAHDDLEKALLMFVKEGNPAPTNETLLSLWTEASVDNNPTGDEKGFMGQVPLVKGEEADEGKYTLYARFADDTFDEVLKNYGEVEEVLTVLYDKAVPVFTDIKSNIEGTALVYRNTNVSFGGTSTDGNGIASVIVSYKKDGADPVTLLNQTDGLGTWSTSLETSLGDGSYELTFTATDNAGKTTEFTRNVMIDTASPLLAITLPSASEGVSRNAYTIRGTVDDGNGKGVSSIEYSLDSTDGTDGTWETITRAASWNADITLTDPEGLRTLWVRASDGLNDPVVETVNFQYDTEDPALTVNATNIPDSSLVYRKEAVNFTGTASDTNKLVSVKVRINDGNEIEVTDTNSDGNTDTKFDTWSYTLPATEGNFKIDFIATDIANRTKIETRNVMIDTKAPVVTIVTPAAGTWNGSAPLNVTGNASDDSGVAEVRYTVVPGAPGAAPADPESWTAFTGTTSLTASLTGLAEGENTLWIYAEDTLGNNNALSLMSHSFKVDTEVPYLSVTGGTSARYILTGDTTTTVSFAGTASDTAELDSVTISVGSYSQTINAPLTNDEWTAAAIDVSEFTANTANIVEITAFDKYGRTKTEKVTVYRDTQAPVTKVTTVNQLLDFGGHTNAVNGSVEISGTLSDNTGIAGYRYTLSRSGYTSKTTTVAGAASTFAINLNTLDASIMDFDSNGTPDNKFELTVKIEAYDASGNVSVPTTDPAFKTEFTLYVDQDSDNPVVAYSNLTAGGTAQNNLYDKTSNNKILGTLTDDDGLLNVDILIDSVQTTVFNAAALNNTTSRAFSYDVSGLTEGAHTIAFVLTDKNNKIVTTAAENFAVDAANPVITVTTTPNTYIKASTPVTVTGTASDGNGFTSIEDVVDTSAVTLTTGTLATKGSNVEWSYTFTTPAATGSYSRLFRAKDAFNKESTVSYSYLVDSSIPTVVPSWPAAHTDTNIYIDGTKPFAFSGLADDTGEGQSGLSKVYYALTSGAASTAPATSPFSADWKEMAGTAEWNTSITTAVSGVYKLHVIAQDKAGNFSTVNAKTVFIDQTSPAFSDINLIEGVTTYKNADFDITGIVTDTYLDTLTYTRTKNGAADISSTPIPAVSGSTWTLAQTRLTDPLATYVYTFTAKDKSGKTVDFSRTVTVDTQAPKAELTSVTPIVGTNKVNGEITVKGAISDNDKVQTGTYTLQVKDGSGNYQNVEGKEGVSLGANLNNWTFTIDTTAAGFTDNRDLRITINTADRSGNTDTVFQELNIDQSTDNPVVTYSNLTPVGEAKDNLFGTLSNNKILGTFTDDDGLTNVNIVIDGDATPDLFLDAAALNNTTSRAFSYDVSGLTEGAHTIAFVLTDKNNKIVTTAAENFAVDAADPVIAVTTQQNSFLPASTKVTVTGTASDGNGFTSIVDTTTTTPVTLTTGSLTDKVSTIEWSYTFDTPSVTGPASRSFTATDAFGKVSTVVFNYKVDATAPGLTVTSWPSSDYVNLPDNDIYRVKGNASDEVGGSGLNDVRYIVKAGDVAAPDAADLDWISAAGLNPWTANVDMSNKASGVYSLYIMARDTAGNSSVTAKKLIYADTAAPTITPAALTAPKIFNTGFTLTGTANDSSDAFGSVVSVTARANGSINLAADTGHTPDTWKFKVPAGTETGAISDGKVDVVFTVTDGSGKTNTASVNFTLDTAAPELSFTNIEGTAFSASTVDAAAISAIATNFTSPSNKVLGNFTDNASGVRELSYVFQRWNGTSFEQAGLVITDPVSNLTSGSVNKTMDTNVAALAGNKDGVWRIIISAEDAAGNSKTFYSPLFRLDQTKPTLTVQDFTKTTYSPSEVVTVTGSALDTNGGTLSGVNVKIYNASSVLVSNTNPVTNGSNVWTTTYTIPASGGAGNYSIIITATDTAGNSSEQTKSISCDETPPSMSFNRPYSLAVDSNTNHTTTGQTGTLIGEISVQGTIPLTEFSMKEIYYQVGGSVSITKGGTTFSIEDEGYADLNAASGKITSIDIATNGSIFSGTTSLSTGVILGDWVKAPAQWSWAFEFDSIPLIDTPYLYQTPGSDPLDTNLKTVNVYVAAHDTAGNVNFAVYPINLDTNTDKPVPAVLSPENGSSVGGVFTITGSATDNNFVHSVYMQVELTNGNYDVSGNLIRRSDSGLFPGSVVAGGTVYIPNGSIDNADFTAETAYFTNRNNWYKVDFTSATSSWKQRINNLGEFLNANLEDYYAASHVYNSEDQSELTIKVMAIDTKTTGSLDRSVSGISPDSIIRIDGDNPGIVLDGFPDHNSYVSGDITVDITLTDNVKVNTFTIKAGSTVLATEANIGSTVNGLTVNKVNDGEIKITGAIDSTSASLISPAELSISVYDDLDKNSSVTRKVYIDNNRAWDKNNGYLYGAKTYIDNRGTNSYLTITGTAATIAGKATDVPDGSAVEGSGVKYVMFYLTKNGKVYNTGGATKDTTGEPLIADAIYADVYSLGTYTNQQIDFPVANLAAISPNKYAVTATPYIIIDSPEGGSDKDPDGDKYMENLTANNEWYILLDSKKVNDGLYEANYLIFDNAGNITYYQDSVLVANNPPKISSVVLATDINGNGTALIDAGDENFLYAYDGSGAIDASDFTITNTSFKLQVNVTPGTGNGTLTYHLRYPNSGGTTTEVTTTDGLFEYGVDILSFPTDTITNSIPDASRSGYVVWVTDSTDVPLTSGEADITLKLDNDDDIDPTAELYELNTTVEDSAIEPIADNDTMGSLYITSPSPLKYSGHIEPRTASNYDNTVQDPDVSGTIVLRGNAYDNRRIKSLELVIDNGTPIVLASAATGELIVPVGLTSKVQIAQTLDNSGHQVEWSYAWDTTDNGSGNNAENNISVRVQATDASNNDSQPVTYPAAEHNETTVDVVPYITKITTSLDKASLNNPSVFNRSSNGFYPVRRGETFKISGFNLNGTSTNVTINGTAQGLTVGEDGADVTVAVGTGTAAATRVVSGPLVVSVNSVPSLNNTNADIDSNNEPNNTNNNLLSDDRNMYVWSFTQVVSNNNIRFPTMRIGKDTNQTIGFVYDSGAQAVRMNSGSGLTERNDYCIDYSFTQWYDTAAAVDTSGRIYGVSQNGDSGGTGEQIYNGNYSNSYFYAWNTAELPDTVRIWNKDRYRYEKRTPEGRANAAYSTGIKKRAIESTNNGTLFNGNRVVAPKIAVAGSVVYMVYYDSSTDQIRFRNGTVSGTLDNPAMSNGLVNHDKQNYGSGINYHVIAGGSSTSTPTGPTGTSTSLEQTNVGKAGEYSAVGVTSAGVAIVAWYDASSQSLLLSYNTTPTLNTADAQAQWGVNTRLIDNDFAGWYVDMAVDAVNGIHLAYYGAAGGDLKYAYLENYTAAPQVVTVDSYLSVGVNVSIDVLPKTIGATTYQVPHISYFMSAFNKTSFAVKTAWLSTLGQAVVPQGAVNDMYTGDWEIMTLPLASIPLDYTIGIGIKKNELGADSPLLGYGTKTGLEVGRLE